VDIDPLSSKLREDIMSASTPPDLNTKMTERARTVWSLGDFARAGTEQVIVGELLCRAIDVRPGERVLDVAAGSGNAALAAARRGARVIATDFVPQLLQTAARRAEAEGLELETREADAQALPLPTARSTWCCPRSASCSPPTRPVRRGSCCGSAAPAAASA
jgi:2-polyprenyl-3-methyl-5-hydroxy-6-metoxy-1,4-benzoquinol methylase